MCDWLEDVLSNLMVGKNRWYAQSEVDISQKFHFLAIYLMAQLIAVRRRLRLSLWFWCRALSEVTGKTQLKAWCSLTIGLVATHICSQWTFVSSCHHLTNTPLADIHGHLNLEGMQVVASGNYENSQDGRQRYCRSVHLGTEHLKNEKQFR